MNGESFFSKLTGLVTGLTFVAFSLMCIIAFTQVVARYVFSAALSWPEEASSYLFLCTSYLGMALCMENNSHLRIDVLLNYVPHSARKVLDIITILGDIAFCITLIGMGGYLTWDIWDMGQMTVSFPLPVWMVVIMIPLGGLCILLYALRNLSIVWKRP